MPDPTHPADQLLDQEGRCTWEVLMADGHWASCGAHNGTDKWHFFGGSTWMSTRELKRSSRGGFARTEAPS